MSDFDINFNQLPYLQFPYGQAPAPGAHALEVKHVQEVPPPQPRPGSGKKTATIEIKNPEQMLEHLLNVISGYEFNDGMGQLITEESDVDVASLDEHSKPVWDLYNKIKEQL